MVGTFEHMPTLEEQMKSANKEFGDRNVYHQDGTMEDVERLPTGIMGIDLILRGGLPRGSIVEFYGAEGCLDSETFIRYTVRHPGEYQNEGCTIEDLHHKFHQVQHSDIEDLEFYVPSVDENGDVFMNRVVNVVDSGLKECLKFVTTDGLCLTGTADHKILTPLGFVPLGDLTEGSTVTARGPHRPDPEDTRTALTEIESIAPVGVRHTYDMTMTSPHNNYVANDIVVHNSGKSSLAMLVIAQAQRRGGKCVFIDAENAWNPQMAASCGIDIPSLWLSQPPTAEQALGTLRMAVGSSDLDVIVIDSVAALTPRAELEGDIGDTHVGLQARLMSQSLRVVSGEMKKADSQAVVLFINQIREKIGGFGGFGSGPQTQTTGGRALRFWADVRVEVTKIGQIKGKPDEDPIGHQIKIKVVKNRTAPPLRTFVAEMYYSHGISNGASVLDLGIEMGLIQQKGAWFTNLTTGEKLGQGRVSVVEKLDNDTDLIETLQEAITERLNA